MAILSIVAAAAAPGLALLSYIYLKDKYESEPLHLVGKLFLFGLLSVFPAMLLQRGLTLWLGTAPLTFSFLTTSVIEEGLKWLIVFLAVYRHSEFDEPYDGIVYATSVSLGFATMENLMYAMSEAYSVSALFIRALLPVSGHALFGVVMGYYFGQAKFAKHSSWRLLAYSIIYPVFWHGLFDFVMITAKSYWIWLIVPLMTVLWIRGLSKMSRANHHSPLRIIRREEEFKI
jgi:protease PrsW